jgi:hypothetical protein
MPGKFSKLTRRLIGSRSAEVEMESEEVESSALRNKIGYLSDGIIR